LFKVFLQRRRDFVGVPVPVGEKADDHALLETVWPAQRLIPWMISVS
jgi:hypothetical protein